jgi:hypothetical protein
MSATTRYVIPDEPQPSGLGHLVVRPSAPLLATMLAGAWLAWPWFALNAFALGSPTRRKEVVLCAIAFAGTAALAIALVLLHERGVVVGLTAIRLALLGIATWKLAMAYWVCTVQSRTFHVYEHYRGVVRNPARVLIAGAILRAFVIGLVDSDLWRIILAGGV